MNGKNRSDMDNNVITLLDNCKTAVIEKDIVALIKSMRTLGLDNNSRSPLLDYTRNLIVEDIKDYMIQNKKETIRISRKNVYHEETFDWYSLKDGELFRNGFKVTFDSVGKLYSAYKKIHKIE